MIIGRQVEVLDERNNVKFRGIVSKESKNTFVLDCDDGKKRTILKKDKKLVIYLNNSNKIKIIGNKILKRPWEYEL